MNTQNLKLLVFTLFIVCFFHKTSTLNAQMAWVDNSLGQRILEQGDNWISSIDMGENYNSGLLFTNRGTDKQVDLISDRHIEIEHLVFTSLALDKEIKTKENLLMAIAKERVRKESLDRCLDLMRHSKWKNARIVLADFIKKYNEPSPDYNTALYNLGKTKMNTEDYVGALETYKIFLKTDNIALEQKEEIEFYQALLISRVNEALGKKYLTRIANDYAHNFQANAEGILSIE